MEKVKVINTNTVFDGMTGLVESEDGDKITVMLDFDDKHKVRNTFNKDNLEDVNEQPASVEEEEVDEDLEPMELPAIEDGCILALAQYLDIDPYEIDKEYEDEEYGRKGHTYIVAEENEDHGGEEWLVFSEDDYSEAEEMATESIRECVEDIGPAEYFGVDTCVDYLSSDYFDDYMREDIEFWVDDMDFDDLVSYMEQYNIIDEEDKVQDPNWEADPDLPDDEQEPDMVYDEDFIESKKDELKEAMIDAEGDSVEWYRNTFGDGDLKELIKNDWENCLDLDGLIGNPDVGAELGREDGEEHWEQIEREDGTSEGYYLYWVE